MPLYVFKNPSTGEVKEVSQLINDNHLYVDQNGLKWERVFTVPYASVDTSVDAFSEKDFAKKTASKNYKLGDMWDLSKELGDKRRKTEGKDSVNEKHLKDKERRNSKKKKS